MSADAGAGLVVDVPVPAPEMPAPVVAVAAPPAPAPAEPAGTAAVSLHGPSLNLSTGPVAELSSVSLHTLPAQSMSNTQRIASLGAALIDDSKLAPAAHTARPGHSPVQAVAQLQHSPPVALAPAELSYGSTGAAGLANNSGLAVPTGMHDAFCVKRVGCSCQPFPECLLTLHAFVGSQRSRSAAASNGAGAGAGAAVGIRKGYSDQQQQQQHVSRNEEDAAAEPESIDLGPINQPIKSVWVVGSYWFA